MDRVEISQGDRGLEILIRGRRSLPFVLLSGMVALGASAILIGFAVLLLIERKDAIMPLSSPIPLIGVTSVAVLVNVLTWWIFLWNLGGTEHVTIGGGRVTLRSRVGGIALWATYPAHDISDVRYDPSYFFLFWNPAPLMSALRMRAGVVSFRYVQAVQRFGAGLTEAEAGKVIDALRMRDRI